MNMKPSKTKLSLFDKHYNLLGKVVINEIDGLNYLGKLEFIDFPIKLMELFREYEKLVNSNVLSSLDKIDDQINLWGLKVNNFEVYDVQIMNQGDIIFKSRIPIPL